MRNDLRVWIIQHGLTEKFNDWLCFHCMRCAYNWNRIPHMKDCVNHDLVQRAYDEFVNTNFHTAYGQGKK